jgi:hypothetical protein
VTQHPQPSATPEAERLPWAAPALKKGRIGAETANVGGRNFDGNMRGTNS